MSRDVNGWSPEEVCDLLGISEGNQRVLLHRVRAKVRGVRKEYVAPATDVTSERIDGAEFVARSLTS